MKDIISNTNYNLFEAMPLGVLCFDSSKHVVFENTLMRSYRFKQDILMHGFLEVLSKPPLDPRVNSCLVIEGFHFNVLSYPVDNGDTVVMLRDISDDVALQTVEDHRLHDLEVLINELPVGIAVFQKQGGVIRRMHVNRALLDLKGVSEEEILNEDYKEMFNRVYPDDLMQCQQDLEDIFTKGHCTSFYRTYNNKKQGYMTVYREGISVHQEGFDVAYVVYQDVTERVEAEDALKESRLRYQLAIEGASLAMCEYDVVEHRIYSPEKSLSRMHIPDIIENVPDSILPFIDEEDRKGVQDMFDLVEQGEPYGTADFWAEWGEEKKRRRGRIIFSSAFDDHGHPIKAYGLLQDITNMERERRRYMDANKELLDANPHALYAFRLNLTENICMDAHGQNQEMIAKLSASSCDRFFKNLSHTIAFDKERKSFDSLMNRERLIENFKSSHAQQAFEYSTLMNDRSLHFISIIVTMMNNPDTEDIEAIVYASDHSNERIQRQIVDILTNSEYDFISLVNCGNRNVRYHSINEEKDLQSMTHMMNYDDEIKNAALTMPDEDAKNFLKEAKLEHIIKEIDEKGHFLITFAQYGAHDQLYYKQCNYTYLDRERGIILAIKRDITAIHQKEDRRLSELQKALASAKEANATKSRFLSNVSHDMRTPLNGVIGYTDLALHSRDEKERQNFLEKISQSSALLLELINDTLDLSKIETGSIVLKKQHIDCQKLIDKITASIEPSMNQKQISFDIRTDLPQGLCIEGDQMKIEEIILNLLSNAMKFTPNRGQVTYTTTCDYLSEENVQFSIEIKDNGIGISEEFMPHLFEPFMQERTEETADIGGTGLGLAIVKSLVELMQGTIRVESVLNEGTTFMVTLNFKRVKHADAKMDETEVSYKVLRNKKVLLVEDNELNADIAVRMLASKDIHVERARNGKEALNLFKNSAENTYDTILMDIRMPVMNGYEASRAIRKLSRVDASSVPIIAMTADAYAEDVAKALEAGMNAHLAKPINFKELFAHLVRYMS